MMDRDLCVNEPFVHGSRSLLFFTIPTGYRPTRLRLMYVQTVRSMSMIDD